MDSARRTVRSVHYFARDLGLWAWAVSSRSSRAQLEPFDDICVAPQAMHGLVNVGPESSVAPGGAVMAID
jgi:hypothetical protein